MPKHVFVSFEYDNSLKDFLIGQQRTPTRLLVGGAR